MDIYPHPAVAMPERLGVMSLRAMLAVLDHSESIGTTRCVLLAIAEYAHDDGSNAFPSIPTIAKKARCTERAVQYSISRLIALGEVIKQERPTPGKRSGTNVYQLVLPGLVGDGDRVKNIHPVGEKYSPSRVNVGSPDPLLRSSNRQSKTTDQIGESGDSPVRATNTKNTSAKDYEPAVFDRFWALYPRKVSKAAARKAWNKLRPDRATQRAIKAALVAQGESEQWRKDGGRFIPHAATWLNGRRWEDEIAQAPIATSAKTEIVRTDENGRQYNGYRQVVIDGIGYGPVQS